MCAHDVATGRETSTALTVPDGTGRYQALAPQAATLRPVHRWSRGPRLRDGCFDH